MGQPTWKLLTSSDHFAIFIDATGQYPAEIEMASGCFDSKGSEWYLYRWPLDRMKWYMDDESNRFLVPFVYDASWSKPAHMYKEWFIDSMKEVSESCGIDLDSLLHQLTVEDPMALASVYMDIAGYHGPDNFDQYPRVMSDNEFKKYTNKNW